MTDKELGLTDTEALENMPVSKVMTQLYIETYSVKQISKMRIYQLSEIVYLSVWQILPILERKKIVKSICG